MTAYGVMFHHFHDQHHPPGGGSIDARQLERILDHFGDHRLLPARDWLEGVHGGRLPEDAVCLTFDDNLRCQFDIALPVLRRRGLTAFWFVHSCVLQGRPQRLEIYRRFRLSAFRDDRQFLEALVDAIRRSPASGELDDALRTFNPGGYLQEFPFYSPAERTFRYLRDDVLGPRRYRRIMDGMLADRGLEPADLAANLWMDAECLRTLHGDQHLIGLHSHTHPTRLAALDYRRQAAEYRRNHRCLSSLLNVPIVTMSHPCNSYDERTLQILRELGVTLGFRANRSLRRFGPLEWPREDHANIMASLQS